MRGSALKERPGILLLSGLMLLGIIIRASNYLFADISFWADEAAVALNICHRNYLDLFLPLDYGQVAPIGFCLLEKTAVLLFGNNEPAFRLFPFLTGTAAIVMVFFLVHRSIGLLPALLCAAQLAVIKEPVFFSNNLKPYASDLAIAVGLMLVFWKIDPTQRTRRRFAAVAATGSVALWFSFPAIFILGGIGALWLVDWIGKRDGRSLFILGSIFALWLASFWWHYHFLQAQTQNDYLLGFWGNGFMPLPPKALEDLKFFLHLPLVFRDPLWTAHPYLSLILFSGGCLLMWQKHRRLLIVVLIPLVLNLAASGLHKYPFGGRMLQYATINLFIPIAVCLVFLLSWCVKKKWLRMMVILLIAANLTEPAVNGVKDIFHPRKREQVKQIAEQLVRHEAGTLPYFIFGSSFSTYSYYMERLGLKPVAVIVGPGRKLKDPDKIRAQIADLHGGIWLLFGHAKQHVGFDYERLYLEAADSRGVLMEKLIDVGAAAYLYRFP